MNNKLHQSYETAIETLLRQSIGLEATSIGSRVIAGAGEQRRITLGLPDLPAYYAHLLANQVELEALIEAVVVPETWFFRDREPFNYLGQYIRNIRTELLTTPYPGVLNILSAPCATGEEPYSIAITLLEAGLSATGFHIDALDISKVALAKAQQALYSQNSFRGGDNTFRDRYFQSTPSGYKLSPTITTTVNFQQGNLLEMNSPHSGGFYDVIFCRNVLIYFDAIARTKTIQHLHYLLKPQGLLFVGHSETGQFSTSPQFAAIQHPHAFAYRKVEEIRRVTLPLPDSRKEHHLPTPSPPLTSPLISPKVTDRLPPQPPKSSQQDFLINPSKKPLKQILKSSLAEARDLADRGHLEAAIKLCETHLQQNRTSADGYCLLAELHQAQGQWEQAEQNFERAIYLNPHLEEALVHLALIKENQGDLDRAAMIWQRVQRLQK